MIEPDMLACPYHWRLMPAPLKADVWRTWKARMAAPRDAAARTAHQEACARATAAMHARAAVHPPLEMREP